MKQKSLGQIAYVAYCKADHNSGYSNPQGHSFLWDRVANAVAREVRKRDNTKTKIKLLTPLQIVEQRLNDHENSAMEGGSFASEKAWQEKFDKLKWERDFLLAKMGVK